MSRPLWPTGLEVPPSYLTWSDDELERFYDSAFGSLLLALSSGQVIRGLQVAAADGGFIVGHGAAVTPSNELVIVPESPESQSPPRPARLVSTASTEDGTKWVALAPASIQVVSGYFMDNSSPTRSYDSYAITMESTPSPGAEYVVLARITIKDGAVVSVEDMRDLFLSGSVAHGYNQTHKPIPFEWWYEPVRWHNTSWKVLTASPGSPQPNAIKMCMYAFPLRYDYMGNVGIGRNPKTGFLTSGFEVETPWLFRVVLDAIDSEFNYGVQIRILEGDTGSSFLKVIQTAVDDGAVTELLVLDLADPDYDTVAEIVAAIDDLDDISCSIPAFATENASSYPAATIADSDIRIQYVAPADIDDETVLTGMISARIDAENPSSQVHYNPYGNLISDPGFSYQSGKGRGSAQPPYSAPSAPMLEWWRAATSDLWGIDWDRIWACFENAGRRLDNFPWYGHDPNANSGEKRLGEMVVQLSLPMDLHVPASGDGTHVRFYATVFAYDDADVDLEASDFILTSARVVDGDLVDITRVTRTLAGSGTRTSLGEVYVDIENPQPGDLVHISIVQPEGESGDWTHRTRLLLGSRISYYREHADFVYVGKMLEET